MATAHDIYDSAPIGSVIRFTDGQEKPPARFKQKVRAWEKRNASGTLTEKHAPGKWTAAHFVLTNDFGWLTVSEIHDLDSRLRFEVISMPPAESPVHNPAEPTEQTTSA